MPYCPSCGSVVEVGWRFCRYCGQDQGAPSTAYRPPMETIGAKDPIVALLLALIPGLFGIWGIGHFYVDAVSRGIVLLVVGISLAIFLLLSLSILSLFVLIVGFVIWLWQAYDAYQIARGLQTFRYYR